MLVQANKELYYNQIFRVYITSNEIKNTPEESFFLPHLIILKTVLKKRLSKNNSKKINC